MQMHTKPISFPVTAQSAAPSWLADQQAGDVQLLFSTVPQANDEANEEATSPAGPTQADMERELAQAVARAEAEGRARGEAEGLACYEQVCKRTERALVDLIDMRQHSSTSMERQMVDLALCVARVILERELSSDRDYILRLVREAVGMISGGDAFEISVAPADHELLSTRLDEITRDNPRAKSLEIKVDKAIEAGCIVETKLARIDATVLSRLRNISESLHQGPSEGGDLG